MAYVDLNPARAAICDALADSDHTSIQRRLRQREAKVGVIRNRAILDCPLKRITEGERAPPADIRHVSKRPQHWQHQVQS